MNKLSVLAKWLKDNGNLKESIDIKEIISQASVTAITLFHGTPLKNVPDILRGGLHPKKPESPGATEAVYLTSNMSLAARYALHWTENTSDLDFQQGVVPTILEVKLTKNKRVRELIWDPLDRKDSAYNLDSCETQEHEDIMRLEYDIKMLLSNLKLNHNVITSEDFDIDQHLAAPSVESLDGVNLIKSLISFVKNNSKNYDPKITKIVHNYFANKEYNLFTVKDDGTIKASEDWYATREQLFYGQVIPPSAIKKIWLPYDYLKFKGLDSLCVEKKTMGMTLMPHEGAGIIESLVQELQNLEAILESCKRTKDLGGDLESEESGEKLNDYVSGYRFEDAVDMTARLDMQDVARDLLELEQNPFDKFESFLEDIPGIVDELYNMQSQDITVNKSLVWCAVNPQSLVT